MGAKCAAPERPVLCFTGDGGIWYHIAELETAVRCGINTVTLVNNNHSLNQERDGVETIYGGTTTGSDELWLFEDADFAAIAESFGCLGLTVTEPSEIAGALERAFAADRPVVMKTDVEDAPCGRASRRGLGPAGLIAQSRAILYGRAGGSPPVARPPCRGESSPPGLAPQPNDMSAAGLEPATN